MTSRRARERANARPWEQGEQPEPEDRQHAGDFPEYDEQPLRCPNTDDHQAVKDYAAKLAASEPRRQSNQSQP